MKKIYISAPISGYDLLERKATFHKVKEILENEGYTVLNPMENGLPAEATTSDHMRADFKMMCEADEALFLDKWLHSAGCHTEFMVATAIGLTIHFGRFVDGHLFTDKTIFQ